jgi:hypothetical protein
MFLSLLPSHEVAEYRGMALKRSKNYTTHYQPTDHKIPTNDMEFYITTHLKVPQLNTYSAKLTLQHYIMLSTSASKDWISETGTKVQNINKDCYCQNGN